MNRWDKWAEAEAGQMILGASDFAATTRAVVIDMASKQRDALAAEFRGAFSKNRVMSGETAERIALDIINGNEGAER